MYNHTITKYNCLCTKYNCLCTKYNCLCTKYKGNIIQVKRYSSQDSVQYSPKFCLNQS